MREWLQRYAAAGNAVWITAKLFHDWAFVMSLLAAGGLTALTWWEWGTQLGYSPLILVALLTATAIIWMINGMRVLFRRGTPTKPKMSFDYAYSLALVRPYLGRDMNDDVSYIQPGVVWKNAGPAALKYHVDHFRTVIGDRTVEGQLNREGIISRDCEMIFMNPPFSKKQLSGVPQKTTGVIEYRVRYGHPEHGFLRHVTARLNTTFDLGDKGGIVYLVDYLKDEEINS